MKKEMKLEAWKEEEKVFVYTMRATKYNYENWARETWESAVMKLMVNKATFSSGPIRSVEMLQTGKQPNGLYENYIKMIVRNDDEYDYDKFENWLDDLGFVYQKEETTMYTFYVDFGEAGLTYDCEVAIEVE